MPAVSLACAMCLRAMYASWRTACGSPGNSSTLQPERTYLLSIWHGSQAMAEPVRIAYADVFPPFTELVKGEADAAALGVHVGISIASRICAPECSRRP